MTRVGTQQDTILAFFQFLDKTLFRLVSLLTQLLLLSAVGAGFYQVLARFVLESPADWSEAWTRAALIWTVMLGIALAFRHGAMLSVEMLHGFLGPRNKRLLEHVILVICVGFLGFLAWVGGQMTYRVRFQTTPSLEMSISWIYIAIPIGATLAILAVIAYWAEGPHEAVVDETTL
ncbi:TRAP transporter small permease [Pusillimonas sp. ANT_WB101]|uniref:TRAP transporter small permease n=1 Tax=Pusillimonas sp. ANT_WB101 TaxID=2597356 RepID=UPI0011EBF222|nr:TRAP transporter small permease [Pusillimonas sp. ANT_WB101]KAA0891146.1 TRAP transporter small permease [Pusillimonas sp. ANT_WB101]